jgi:polyisoprenoid-binding protein YceI
MPPPLRRTLLALVAAAQCAGATAATETFTITPANTVPSFEVRHSGFATQRGRFGRTEGRVVMDPAKQQGEVDIVIDARSVDTGLGPLDEALRSADFLDAGRHPVLSFRSSRFHFNRDRLVAVDGTLTLLGVAQPISLKVTHYECSVDPATARYHCEVDAEASFRRSAFGMDYLVPMVADEVKLQIKVNADRDL